jgi:very-short-patch-repair endonuclease
LTTPNENSSQPYQSSVAYKSAEITATTIAAYKPVALMTPNEVEFFRRLCRSLPAVHVFPQVAMAALIEPVDSFQKNRQAYWKINEKRVDYAIYSKSMELICIIELDDRMHNIEKDKERDQLTSSAGVFTLRWQSHAKPSELEIFQAVNKLPHMLNNPLQPIKPHSRKLNHLALN